MGTSTAETVKEIEDTRDRLERDLRELEGRLPRPAVWTKRLVGVALGGGMAGSALWMVVRRRKKKKEKAPVPTIVTAVPMQRVVQVLPDRWSKRLDETLGSALEDGRWKGWAAAAGGTWVLMRAAEIRQLRRMNRAILARSR